MAMTIKLFKGAKVDGITRLAFWRKSEQIAYFDTLESKTYSVNTVRLGEPLRINDKLNNLLQYSYGYLDYGDGFRYYFAVGDLQFITETITDVSYSIDCWSTAQTQTDMRIGRKTITRYPQQLGKISYPYNEYHTIDTYNHSKDCGVIVGLCNDDNNNIWTFVVKAFDVLSEDHYSTQYTMLSGLWLNYVKDNQIRANQILSIGIISERYQDSFLTSHAFTDITKDVTEGVTYPVKVFKTLGISVQLTVSNPMGSTATMTNTGKSWSELRDLKGNTIFTCPRNRTLRFQSGAVIITGSSIGIRYAFKDTSNNIIYAYEPSETPIIINDAYTQYMQTQRAIDVEARNLQINQQLMSGIANSATSAVSGIIGGGVAGIGALAGAGVGAGAGIISAVGNYAISSYYAPKEQALTDKTYYYANDTLLTSGSASMSIFTDKLAGMVTVSYDQTTTETIDTDVNTNGFYTNYVTDSATYFKEGFMGPITLDAEILGDIPVAWKEQIHTRLLGGVKFV